MDLCVIGLVDRTTGLVEDPVKLRDLADRIIARYPRVAIKELHDFALLAWVPRRLTRVIPRKFGCVLTWYIPIQPQPPAPPQPEGIPNWDFYERAANRMSDGAFDQMIESFNKGEGDGD